MKSKWTITGSIVAVLLLVLAVGLTRAQGPEPPGEGVEPQGDVRIAATVAHKISYQGVLEENGSPVTGNRNLTFRLYSDSTCTTRVGSDVVVANVPVNNGLFSVDVPLGAFFNGQALWLKVVVGGTDLGMCQEILPVPYALSLRPWARIEGSGNGNILYVRNTSTGYLQHGIYGQTDSTDQGAGVVGWASPSTGFNYGVEGRSASSSGTGVFGYATAATGLTRGVEGRTDSTSGTGVRGYASANTGTTFGVYGTAQSPDGYGVYARNNNGVALKAGGTGVIQSAANSYVFVPGGEAQLAGAPSDASLRYWARGTVDVLLSSGSNVTKTVAFPVSLPAVLYGQPVRVAGIRVYYKTTNSATYISGSNLYREKPDGSYYTLISDPTNRTSTTFTSYYISCSEVECRLSDDEGFITVALDIYFANSSHYINLGGVRVTLEHD